jgi:hypothetical protein
MKLKLLAAGRQPQDVVVSPPSLTLKSDQGHNPSKAVDESNDNYGFLSEGLRIDSEVRKMDLVEREKL